MKIEKKLSKIQVAFIKKVSGVDLPFGKELDIDADLIDKIYDDALDVEVGAIMNEEYNSTPFTKDGEIAVSIVNFFSVFTRV